MSEPAQESRTFKRIPDLGGGPMLRLLLVVLACLLAILVLLGVDLGSLGDVKALALAVLLVAIALVVP